LFSFDDAGVLSGAFLGAFLGACNTIARKPQHDKTSRLSRGPRGLNPVARIAIVAKVVTKVSAQPEFSP
jgi:hypothetical protein